mmetsp:Transcript_61156/g.131959  ORF Transcript_61156/g.131959 Transcript_61156/m.131959 type:complete len:274 (+) Transcript_61156:1194-2015(+)
MALCSLVAMAFRASSKTAFPITGSPLGSSNFTPISRGVDLKQKAGTSFRITLSQLCNAALGAKSILLRSTTTFLPFARICFSSSGHRVVCGSLASTTSTTTSAASIKRFKCLRCSIRCLNAVFARSATRSTFRCFFFLANSSAKVLSASRPCDFLSARASRASFLASSLAASRSFSFSSFFRWISRSNCSFSGQELGTPGSFFPFFTITPAFLSFLASLRCRRLCTRHFFWIVYFNLSVIRLEPLWCVFTMPSKEVDRQPLQEKKGGEQGNKT